MTQLPDSRPGPYYVSMIDGKRTALLLGPFARHADALALVDRAAMVADDVQPGAWFNAFGTVRMEGCTRKGVLNARFPELGFDNPPTSDLSVISIVKGVHNMRRDDDEVKVDDVSTGTDTDPQPDSAAQAQPASGGKKALTDEQRAAKNKVDRDRRAAKKQAASGGEQQARPAEGEVMATSKAKKAGAKKARKAAPKKELAAKKQSAKRTNGNGHAESRGDKTRGIAHLLQRKTGCTAKDVLDLTGWPSVSMPAMSKACNLKLRKERVEGKEGARAHTRYFGTPA